MMLNTMTTAELTLVLSFFIGVSLSLLLVINAVHFYHKHYKALARQVDGSYHDIGFLLASSRLMLWGHYCLFPARSRKSELSGNNLKRVFAEQPTAVRMQLIFHWFAVVIGCLSFMLGGILSP